MPSQWAHAEHVREVDGITAPGRGPVDVSDRQPRVVEGGHRCLGGVVPLAQPGVTTDLRVADADDCHPSLLRHEAVPAAGANTGMVRSGESTSNSTITGMPNETPDSVTRTRFDSTRRA